MTAPISAYDSRLFRKIFTAPAIREEFTDVAFMKRCIEAEVALAVAEAELGVIPASAAKLIKAGCDVQRLDMDRLRDETEIVGYPILPLIKQLEVMCTEESGRYLHWGTTTQDIMDTASMLQMKAGLAIMEEQLKSLCSTLASLSSQYRDTPMAGRTHLQHALPITFGYKTAVWLSSCVRHLERLEQIKARCLLVQFGGAAGTLASLGGNGQGLAIRKGMAGVLGLGEADISWHVARDGVAEILNFLGLVGGSLGKIALDLMIMSSNEYSEVQEPFVPHRGASSTMPQKRNPIASEAILASSKLLRNHVSLGLDAMVSDFERPSGPWHLEWVAVPEAFCVASGALEQANFVMSGLCIDTERMMTNLLSTRGLIVGEAVMMGLAPYIGRLPAHDIVYEACKECIESTSTLTLYEVLARDPQVNERVDNSKLKELCDPTKYIGDCGEMVDRTIASWEKIHK